MQVELLSLRNVSISREHSAFTDLIEWRGRYYLGYREGASHRSYRGRIVILVSDDLEQWNLSGVVSGLYPDLRDPKFLATDDELLVYGAAWAHPDPGDIQRHGAYQHLYVSSTRDGLTWSPPEPLHDPSCVIWRPVRVGDLHYAAIHYRLGEKADDHLRWVTLASTVDGRTWEHVSDIWREDGSNETQVYPLDDGRLVALIRCARKEPGSPTAVPNLLAIAEPPYQDWDVTRLEHLIHGPAIYSVGGHLVAGGRIYGAFGSDVIQHAPQMALFELDAENKRSRALTTLPSWGDCSYPAMLELSCTNAIGVRGRRTGGDDSSLTSSPCELAVSYYSSHEGPTQVYLARLRMTWEHAGSHAGDWAA